MGVYVATTGEAGVNVATTGEATLYVVVVVTTVSASPSS